MSNRDDILKIIRAQNDRIDMINWHLSAYMRERSQLEVSNAELRGRNDYLDGVPASRNPFAGRNDAARAMAWRKGWHAERKDQGS